MSSRRELEVTPEPPPEVARAIAAAVRVVVSEPDESPWWRAGIDEALREDEERA